MRTVTLSSPAPHRMGEYLSLQDAASRAFGAAKLALRGEAWGYSLQVDCAADILSDVLSAHAAARHGSPADVLAWIDYCDRFPVLARRFDADAIPAAILPFSRLYGMASNWRRAEVSRRERTGKLTLSGQQNGSGPEQHRDAGSPAAARATAVDVLDALGMARLGKLYPVAYAAARDADGLTGDEIAAELRMQPATLRKQISRAGERIPSAAVYGPRDHAETLRVDEYAQQGAHRAHAATMAQDWRGEGSPVPEHPCSVRTVDAERPAWDGTASADWTRSIPASTAARLAYAARLQRERAAAREPMQRTAARLAAGLPA